jgi:hypothetical protein
MKKLLYKGIEFDDFQLYNGEPERYGDCQSESLDGFKSVDVYVCPHCIKKYGLYAECGTTEEKINEQIEMDMECNYHDLVCGVKGCYNRNSLDGYFSTGGCQLMENETEEKTTRQYAVKITEISSKIVYVEAESRVDAEIIAEENWDKSEYILDAEDFEYAKFEAMESEE